MKMYEFICTAYSDKDANKTFMFNSDSLFTNEIVMKLFALYSKSTIMLLLYLMYNVRSRKNDMDLQIQLTGAVNNLLQL